MISTGTDVSAAFEHHKAGRLRAAFDGYRTILQREPRHAGALHLLGLLAHQTGDNPTAEGLIRQAIAIAPGEGLYHANLGVVLIQMRRMEEATATLRQAVRLQPDHFGAQSNLGVALCATGDPEGAVKAANAALGLRPGDPATLVNCGDFLEKAGRYGEASARFEAAIQAGGGNHAVHLAYGGLLLVMGRVREALASLDTAISLDPTATAARLARIGALNYLPGATMQEIGDTARRLAPATPKQPPVSFAEVDRTPDRRLRIGYVSADFRNHPVGYFLHAGLAARDPEAATVICYDNAVDADPMTDRLKAAVDHWRPIHGLDDDQAAAMIRSDRIDILVDLAGHTKGNRLNLFARRVAPVQAAWLGYFGTTGVAAMDFVIADRHVLPPHDEPACSERVIRLPDSYLCFSPPAEAGPVAPLPAGREQPITFGCFNKRAKINPDVLVLWARVLQAVPGSRLFLKSAQYSDSIICREITEAFAASGIAADRILFEANSPIAAMFEAYARVDIALDPFPFAGGATTAQALWMGVPVISLVGATWPGRQGASLLHAAGFPDWAVADADSYVALAQRLAADRFGLMALRAGLRAAVAGSPLCRADRFARHFEAACREMWQSYLRSGS
jgi:protein O-GlcNAc transferase